MSMYIVNLFWGQFMYKDHLFCSTSANLQDNTINELYLCYIPLNREFTLIQSYVKWIKETLYEGHHSSSIAWMFAHNNVALDKHHDKIILLFIERFATLKTPIDRLMEHHLSFEKTKTLQQIIVTLYHNFYELPDMTKECKLLKSGVNLIEYYDTFLDLPEYLEITNEILKNINELRYCVISTDSKRLTEGA